MGEGWARGGGPGDPHPGDDRGVCGSGGGGGGEEGVAGAGGAGDEGCVGVGRAGKRLGPGEGQRGKERRARRGGSTLVGEGVWTRGRRLGEKWGPARRSGRGAAW